MISTKYTKYTYLCLGIAETSLLKFKHVMYLPILLLPPSAQM